MNFPKEDNMAGANFKWPVQTDQARITTPYNPATGTLDFHAPKGAVVRAITGGKVYVVGPDWLEVVSEQFSVTYMTLQNVKVQPGQAISAGDTIGESAGESIRLMVYQNFDPTSLFEKPAAPVQPTPPAAQPPTPAPQPSAPADSKPKVIYLKATSDGVRVREKPVDGKPQGQLRGGEVFESMESEADTTAKVGVQGQWLQIRRFDGTTGYVAAWFVELAPEVPNISVAGSLTGINLDFNHPLGRPSPDDLKGIGWIRIKFNMSYNPANRTYGNTDVNATYNRYLPLIEQYARAGIKTLMVFTHQLYGEGAGFNWQQMDPDKWKTLIGRYADYARQVVERFANKNLIHCYQIWNEQDTKEGRAAVAVPAPIYGLMLTETIRAIRKVDSTTPIITGGHTTGPESGSAYARQALAAMPADVRPDGIATHPYGRGVVGHKFSNFGGLDHEIRLYSGVMPGKPIWITEWGVLNIQGNMSFVNDAADYATGFMKICKGQFPGQVAAAIWYAWADSMDNGYGLVDSSGKPKPNLYDTFKRIG